MNFKKFIGSRKMFTVILQALPILLFSYTAQVLFKKGVNALGVIELQQVWSSPIKFLLMLITNWQIVLGFILAGCGAIIYLFALSKNDFSVIFPVLGALGFILLPIIGKFILHEEVSVGRIVGTIVISFGMMIVARG
jgi:multidrug transporter EmrE-like cation transporter